MVFRRFRGRQLVPMKIRYLLIGLFIVIALGVIGLRAVYLNNLKAPSSSQKTQLVDIKSGSSVQQIANQLANQHLIKSAWAFVFYVHSKGSINLQAGIYDLAPDLTTKQIVAILSTGRVESGLVTILPGRRIDQVRADLINDGFNPSSVDNALTNLSQYGGLPVMSFLPAGTDSLEGMLWPDSFAKQPDTDPSVIIRESLVEMGQHITPVVQQALASQGLNVYQGLTLASIVEQEVSKPSDQTQVAQVFYSRLKNNMVLGSDVTAYYGAIMAGLSLTLSYNSPYNTLINKGLPPGPISSISQSALDAVTHPAGTNWLYFVTGDNGITYFSTDYQTHVQQTNQYCHQLCSE